MDSGARPDSASEAWVRNHFQWVAWKLAAYTRLRHRGCTASVHLHGATGKVAATRGAEAERIGATAVTAAEGAAGRDAAAKAMEQHAAAAAADPAAAKAQSTAGAEAEQAATVKEAGGVGEQQRRVGAKPCSGDCLLRWSEVMRQLRHRCVQDSTSAALPALQFECVSAYCYCCHSMCVQFEFSLLLEPWPSYKIPSQPAC